MKKAHDLSVFEGLQDQVFILLEKNFYFGKKLSILSRPPLDSIMLVI